VKAPGGGSAGAWREDTIGHPRQYFIDRGCFIDCRGELRISEHSRWGIGVTVITESHDTSAWPHMGEIIERPVIVDDFAWIGSGSLLCGCHIHHAAIVAAGSVVRGQNVQPFTMVAGNPARTIAHWVDGHWLYLAPADSGYERWLL